MYQIFLSNRAEKDLKKLDKTYRLKAGKAVDFLANNPLAGAKMEGEYKNSYRIKIPPLRVIYTPDFKNKIIWIKAIGFRGGVYK